jgi:hypothetical protein
MSEAESFYALNALGMDLQQQLGHYISFIDFKPSRKLGKFQIHYKTAQSVSDEQYEPHQSCTWTSAKGT